MRLAVEGVYLAILAVILAVTVEATVEATVDSAQVAEPRAKSEEKAQTELGETANDDEKQYGGGSYQQVSQQSASQAVTSAAQTISAHLTACSGAGFSAMCMSLLAPKCTAETEHMNDWIEKSGDFIGAKATSGLLLSVNTAAGANQIRSDRVDHEAKFTTTITGKSCRITRSMGTGTYKINGGAQEMVVEYVKMGVCKPREARDDGKSPCVDSTFSMILPTLPTVNTNILFHYGGAPAGGRRLLNTTTRRRRAASRRRRDYPLHDSTTRRRRDAPLDGTTDGAAGYPPNPDVMCCASKQWIASCKVRFLARRRRYQADKLCKDVTELPAEALNSVAAQFI